MPEVVWINGRFVSRDEARVSAFDAGLLHGVGLFETMLAAPLAGDEDATRGRIVRLDRHLARLEASARSLGLSGMLKVRAFQELLEHVVERSGLLGSDQGPEPRARVRLTVTGGDLNLLASTGKGPTDPTILISVQPATRYPPEMFEKGVRVAFAHARANPLDPFAGHKTLNYWWRLAELRAASAKGAAEAIVLQVTGEVCGGTVSNLFGVKQGALFTPIARGEEEHLGGEDLPSPVLPGITRSSIIEAAHGMSIGCDRRLVSLDDLHDADEIFLTNSSWGVLPVVFIESRAIHDARPGELTRRLREKWLEAARSEP